MVKMVKPTSLHSSITGGAKGDNSETSASKPETEQEIDKEVVSSETIEGKIPNGIKLSHNIMDYIAWKGIIQV